MQIFRRFLLIYILFSWSYPPILQALDYPGKDPGKTHCSVKPRYAILENDAIRGRWEMKSGRMISFSLGNLHTGQQLTLSKGHMPIVVLKNGRKINLASLVPAQALKSESYSIKTTFRDDVSGLEMHWSVTLKDNDNAIIQSLHINASREVEIERIDFINASVDDAEQVGSVDGSVIVSNNLFMAVEHPLAKNEVDDSGHVRCLLPRGNLLNAGESWTYTSVFGAVPPGQLRRGFLYYLERRRAHPYRPFLHYNNWYNVYLERPVERTNEEECLATIDIFGRKLVRERNAKIDAFVWDDGWDDFNSLWDFHKGFPDGFKNLDAAAKEYGASQGVWMSPWGGYARAKEERIAYGRSHEYETNSGGFSMAGKNYGKAFRDVCLKMMREQGVIFFKFDGMGGGNEATGAGVETADDIDAVLDLTKALRQEDPEVFISATIGTWPSPYWLFYANSIWRQGGDNGMFGEGDTRQQWITYRDKYCYERIVQMGPLYPLNSLMLGGIIIGNREGRAPSRFVINDKSVADETWSFFGSGTCLQEMYIDPEILTDTMWDALAAAASWSRENSDILVDTHWIGGDPGEGEVYGWASWRPGQGILVLRNPSETAQEYTMTLKAALELPEGHSHKMMPNLIYPQVRNLKSWPLNVEEPFSLMLEPFEVMVIELPEQKNEGKNSSNIDW